MAKSDIAVGTIATVKDEDCGCGCEFIVEVIGITENGWRIKFKDNGQEAEVDHLERIISTP